MTYPRSIHFLLTLFALSLGFTSSVSAQDTPGAHLIEVSEFHLVGRSLNYLDHEQPDEPVPLYGIDAGFQLTRFRKNSMFGGQNGVEVVLRLGYFDTFSIHSRIASLWTLQDSRNFTFSLGPGGEALMVTSNTFKDTNYIQPLLSLRMGLGLGVLMLRTEYDYHLIRGAHHLRGYLPLFGTVGLGLELGFDRTLSDTLALNNAGALLLFLF